MAKINTSQIITTVAIFAALIGLIIFMRRNDEKEEFSMKKMMADAQARAAKSMKDAKNRDRDAEARAAMKAAKDAAKRRR
jgi:hypothetical protein